MIGEARSPQIEMPHLAVISNDAQRFAISMINLHRRIVDDPESLVVHVSNHVLELELKTRKRAGLILHAMRVTTGASVSELEAAGLTGYPPRSVYRQLGVLHPDGGGMKFGIEDRHLLTTDFRDDPFVNSIVGELQQYLPAA